MIAPPLARNHPCPCGSGRRYKHCHGAPEARPPAAAALDAGSEGGQPMLRARAALAAGDTKTAASLGRVAVVETPDATAWWNLLGEALRVDAPAQAEAAWRRALALDPDDPEAHFHLGNLLRERGDGAAAVLQYRRALEVAPSHVGTLNNLGVALAMTGAQAEAEGCYRAALAVDPQQPDALGNLAAAQFEREAFAEAAASYDLLFAIRRSAPAAVWVRRAIAQQKLGTLDAAEASFREAARLDPDDPRIQVNLGTLLTEQGRYAEAEPALSRALARVPRHPYALSMLVHARQRRCAWDGIDAMFADIERLLDDEAPLADGNVNPFTVLAMPLSPRAQLRAATRWAAQFAPAKPVPRPAPRRRHGYRLRAGFVSSDFREHPIARLMAEMIERLDRSRVETFAYSLAARDDGPFGRRIADAFEHFADVSAQPTAAIDTQIRADGIDVLYDINGYTTHDRSALFALRPAPILVNWLGYPGTLGAGWFDYILTDRFSTPPEAQPWFSERLLPLPGCLFPSDSRREVAAAAPARAEHRLPPHGFVFCAFNNQYKILPPVFDVWMRLLAQVPGSVLWLSAAAPDPSANLRREASVRGIDPSRLVFATRVPLPEHLARHRLADLFLDTAPYNAGTTANDALFMELPVLTASGATMASRMAGCQLHAIGLPELATSNLGDYETLALDLVRHPDRLAALRARLRSNRRTHALFDTARFALDFTDCLMRMTQPAPERGHPNGASSA